LGRWRASRGDTEGALEAYLAVADVFPEAQRSAAALQEARLDAPPVALVDLGEPARVEVTAQGIDALQQRAYAIDLRTVFVRDGGLHGVRDVSVAGVSPAWSAERPLRAGTFPEARTLDWPLQGPGAWLVQLEGDGARADTLFVRSAIALAVTDLDGVRRVTVQRQGRPAAGVEVRAVLANGEVEAARTDLRGIAEVPAGAPVFAWDGPNVAFSDTLAQSRASGGYYEPSDDALFQGVDGRLETQQRADQNDDQRKFDAAQPATMSLEAL
jgi:hypothetical protein